MEREEADWLAELIQNAITQLELSPCLTIEVDGNTSLWMQILPEEHEAKQQLRGLVLNFPYRNHKGDPLDTFTTVGLTAPPNSETLTWEDGGFATIRVRPDTPLVALALFIGDILERIVGTPADCELNVRIEYGF